jgi:hypothetical protein
MTITKVIQTRSKNQLKKKKRIASANKNSKRSLRKEGMASFRKSGNRLVKSRPRGLKKSWTKSMFCISKATTILKFIGKCFKTRLEWKPIERQLKLFAGKNQL